MIGMSHSKSSHADTLHAVTAVLNPSGSSGYSGGGSGLPVVELISLIVEYAVEFVGMWG